MGIEVVPRRIHSSGDAMIGLGRDHRHPDRMRALLTFSDRGNRSYQVDLAPIELRNLLADALKMLTADQAEVSTWWRRLTADDPPGTPAHS